MVAELLELLDADPELSGRFELRAATQRVDIATVRNAVRGLINVDGFIKWDEAEAYSQRVRRAVATIDELIDASAADAAEIALDAIGCLTEACASDADSPGFIGEVAAELVAVHLRAGQAAPPDPVSLAIDLGDLLLKSERREATFPASG